LLADALIASHNHISSALSNVHRHSSTPPCKTLNPLLSIITMSSKPPASGRKRKPTKIPETASSTDGQNPKERKACRVSTNASTSTTASLQVVATEKVTAANTASATAAAKQEDSIESIGQMIEDLSHSDYAQVNAALDALNLGLKDDKYKCYKIQVIVGGCHALVLLLKKCLDKAIGIIPACDQVTKLNVLAELTTLHTTLHILIRLTHHLDESKVGIAAIGGVEAVIKAMNTFPKCQTLQEFACFLVHNLACCSIGKKRIVDADEMEVFLAAINNHLGHADTCERACSILMIMIADSNDNTELFIRLGGATAVAKVKTKWPGNYRIQNGMRHLSKSIAAHFTRWGIDVQRDLETAKNE
jgi:hypothetical protein